MLQKTNDKLSTENNKTYSDIAREAVRQAKTDDTTTRPTITLTDKTNLKMTALILEAHIACIDPQNNFGQTLSDSLKRNFDIDAKFPDSDSRKIFNLYFNPPRNKHDDIYRQCPDDDYIDDNDIRQSSLILSDHEADDVIEDMDAQTTREKRQTITVTDLYYPKNEPDVTQKRQKTKTATDPDLT